MELDVIIIHIRAGQAAEYERLFAERELPRWRGYKARGAFLSARISRVAFGTDDRQDVIKYAIAVEVPGHASHSEHDADPGFQELNRLADLLQPETRWYTAERCCTPSDPQPTSGMSERARLLARRGQPRSPPPTAPCTRLARSGRTLEMACCPSLVTVLLISVAPKTVTSSLR
jgi:hypothetical protein